MSRGVAKNRSAHAGAPDHHLEISARKSYALASRVPARVASVADIFVNYATKDRERTTALEVNTLAGFRRNARIVWRRLGRGVCSRSATGDLRWTREAAARPVHPARSCFSGIHPRAVLCKFIRRLWRGKAMRELMTLATIALFAICAFAMTVSAFAAPYNSPQ